VQPTTMSGTTTSFRSRGVVWFLGGACVGSARGRVPRFSVVRITRRWLVNLSMWEELGLALVNGLVHSVIKNPKSRKSQVLRHALSDLKVLVDEALVALGE
jgi:hypothetical protein